MNEIALLIPHFNNINGLKLALNSVSNIEPVDIILVDDGSTEKPDLCMLQKEFPDLSFTIINHEKNRGIEHALNTGLKYIYESQKYKYIARLDCGDVCHPERFKLQKDFLDNNPDITMVGTWVQWVDVNAQPLFLLKNPLSYNRIIQRMFINNAIAHVSVMFRVSILSEVGFYPTNYKYAEDYAFFFKIIKRFKVANISEVLVTVEMNPLGISIAKRRYQIRSRIRIIIDNWDWNLYCIYGLIRNCVSLCLPYSFVKAIKTRIFK